MSTRLYWSVSIAYLVNTTNPEPESTTFHASAVHVIADQENELKRRIRLLI